MNDPKMMMIDPNMMMIDLNMMTIDPNMMMIDPKMMTIDPKMMQETHLKITEAPRAYLGKIETIKRSSGNYLLTI